MSPDGALEDPSPSLPFVGRRAELDELSARIAEGVGVVVVTGAPGVGKSHLAARWAAERAGDASLAHAELSAATDLEGALRQIGRALELVFGPSDDARAVVVRVGQALAARAPTVLVLDDADAVIEPLAEGIEGWRHPGVAIVLTSRRARLAAPHATVTLGPLPRDEAEALLLARARRVRPGLIVSEAQRESVAALIDRVDALPLGIELLAPRLRLLSPARLLARLEGGAGPRDPLQNALDRSFELLAPWERIALAECTVFRDGFYLEAAEAVVRLPDGAPDVLTVLESLVDQSLLRTSAVPELPDEVRVRFFTAVRERARDELAAHDEAAIAARHAAFYVDAAERWDQGIESADEVEHTARLVVELPNLEAAYARAKNPSARTRLGLVLHMAYQRRGPFGAQARLVEEVRREALASKDDRLIARAELASARVERWANALDASERALARSMEAATRAGDVETEAGCARNLAATRWRRGDLDGFGAHLAHALDAAAKSGRPSDEVNARNGLGILYAERGEMEAAREELERALRLAVETRIPGLVALAHGSLSATMLRAERFEAAEHHASEAIAAYAKLGYLRQWALEHLVRAECRLYADDLAGAHDDAEAGLARARWLGLAAPLARALALRGRIAFFQQEWASAREALEDAATRLRRGLERPPPRDFVALPPQSALRARKRADETTRVQLGDPPEAARLWGYAGAARAMLGHLDAAEDAFLRAGDDEVAAVLRGFVTLAAARDAAARGRPMERPSLPGARGGSAEARRVAELLAETARGIVGAPSGSGVRLEVREGARWFRLDGGDGVDLTRRRALRGVLHGLVERRLAQAGAPLSLDDVLEAGWPGERMSPESGARRVYVTINRLRKLGLGELLLTTGDGYMLAPHVQVMQTD